MSNCIKRAYTLAEVLITLFIVGVLATMTIPNINASTKSKEREAKFQAIYSKLENALQSTDKIYNCYYVPSDNEINNNFYGLKGATLKTTGNEKDCDQLYNKLLENLGSARRCTDSSCIPNNYLKKSPNINTCFQNISKFDILKNGMYITPSSKYKHTFLVDINGKQPPNAYGNDVFLFTVKLTRATGVEDGQDDEGNTTYKNIPAKVEFFPSSPNGGTDAGGGESCDFPITDKRSSTALFNKILNKN